MGNECKSLHTGIFVMFWKKGRDYKKYAGSLHPVIWALFSVLVTQYVAQCFHTGHLSLYRSNGKGSPVLEVMSEVFFTICQVIQTSLLILISSGYTLLQSKLGELDIVLPICLMVAFMHIAFVVVDKVQPDTSSDFSDHDGVKGVAFCCLRLGLYGWFLYAGHTTAQSAGTRVRSFLRTFRVVASLYFLTYPVMWMIQPLVAPYYRKPVMEMAIMAAQVGSNLWLANLFMSRGTFWQVSSLSASPLPGGQSPVRFYKDD